MTEVIKEENPVSSEKAASILNRGGIIIYPTETLYGIGTDAMNQEAVRRVFAIKGREEDKPVPILIRDRYMFDEFAEIPELGNLLIDRFLPGPLTLVLKKKKDFPGIITAESEKVAMRISGHPFVKRLFESLSGPITSTSANLSGMGNVYDFKSVFETFNGKVELIVDSGTLQPSKGSTIVDLTVTPPSILREGDISRELLEEFF